MEAQTELDVSETKNIVLSFSQKLVKKKKEINKKKDVNTLKQSAGRMVRDPLNTAETEMSNGNLGSENAA